MKRKRKVPPRVYQRGESWVADFYFKGERYTKAYPGLSYSAAVERAASDRSEIAKGEREVNGKLWKNGKWVAQVQEEAIQDPKFDIAMAQFLDWYKTENAAYTFEKYATPASKNLQAFFDGYQLSQISGVLIEKYKKDRKTGCSCIGGPKREEESNRCAQCGHFFKAKSNATVNRELTLLRHFFNKCIDFNLARKNPFRTVIKNDDGSYRVQKVKLFKELGRVRWLSEAEAARLLAECNDDLKVVVLMAMQTGFRSKELKTLTWTNIDLVGGTATVINAYAKNGETGTVPLSPDLVDALRRLQNQRKPKASDRVFTLDGEVWKSWREAFDGAVERAGIEDFHFHDSRHCFGSWLAQRRVPFENRQKLMRHKDPKMTMRYSHLDAESEREAINKLPGFNILRNESHQNSQQEVEPKLVRFAK